MKSRNLIDKLILSITINKLRRASYKTRYAKALKHLNDRSINYVFIITWILIFSLVLLIARVLLFWIMKYLIIFIILLLGCSKPPQVDHYNITIVPQQGIWVREEMPDYIHQYGCTGQHINCCVMHPHGKYCQVCIIPSYIFYQGIFQPDTVKYKCNCYPENHSLTCPNKKWKIFAYCAGVQIWVKSMTIYANAIKLRRTCYTLDNIAPGYFGGKWTSFLLQFTGLSSTYTDSGC